MTAECQIAWAVQRSVARQKAARPEPTVCWYSRGFAATIPAARSCRAAQHLP